MYRTVRATGSLTIIIPTRNNAPTLPTLLESVKKQTVAPDEVLVVDGSSNDQTQALARSAGVEILVYACDGDMRGFARNLGARQCRGEFLLFVDSDMELGPTVVQGCKELLSKGFDAVTIPEVNLGFGVLGAVRSWERGLVQGNVLLSPARAMGAQTFESIGGFSETNLGFEDLETQACLLERGAKIGRCDGVIYHHEENLTIRGYLAKRFYYADSSIAYKRNHPKYARIVFSPVERMRMYISGVRTSHDLVPFALSISFRLVEELHAATGCRTSSPSKAKPRN